MDDGASDALSDDTDQLLEELTTCTDNLSDSVRMKMSHCNNRN